MRARIVLRTLGLFAIIIASSLAIAAGASAHQDGTTHTHGNAPADPPGQTGDNHGQQGGGQPTNPNCPTAVGNGCGSVQPGSGNCGHNVGVGSGGADQGYGNQNGACGGSTGCTSNCDPGCTANCNPGCTANCNPGCTANCGTPGGTDGTTGGGPDNVDTPAGGEAEVAGSSANEAVAGSSATASGAVPSGSLPFTGAREDILMAIGGALLLLGAGFHVVGRRARRVAAEPA